MFVEDRLSDKTLSIHSTITEIKHSAQKTTLKLESKIDVKSDTIRALMFIEYGCHRGFTVEELLKHEITSSAFFSIDKESIY